jgi:hypothetical protein
MAPPLAAHFTGGPDRQVFGQVKRPDKRPSTLARTKHMKKQQWSGGPGTPFGSGPTARLKTGARRFKGLTTRRARRAFRPATPGAVPTRPCVDAHGQLPDRYRAASTSASSWTQLSPPACGPVSASSVLASRRTAIEKSCIQNSFSSNSTRAFITGCINLLV